jgi:putative protease
LDYQLIRDGQDVDLGDVKYLLSPQDLAAYERIPDLIDAAGVDYELRMRHYTEGIDETVMFFLPVGGSHG